MEENFLRTNELDIWVFRKDKGRVQYLLLRTSKKKADKWFNGKQFWQIVSDERASNEKTSKACYRIVKKWIGLTGANAIFTDYISSFYNIRTDSMHMIPSFAVEITNSKEDVSLTWEHDSYKWVSFNEAIKLITFESLKESLKKLKGIIEGDKPNWFLKLP